MKITDNRKAMEFPYDSVEEGEVFIYDKEFYIKTDYYDGNAENIISICLSDGHTEYLEDNVLVTVVKAEVIIE